MNTRCQLKKKSELTLWQKTMFNIFVSKYFYTVEDHFRQFKEVTINADSEAERSLYQPCAELVEGLMTIKNAAIHCDYDVMKQVLDYLYENFNNPTVLKTRQFMAKQLLLPLEKELREMKVVEEVIHN